MGVERRDLDVEHEAGPQVVLEKELAKVTS
jgi:hypothetical protein